MHSLPASPVEFGFVLVGGECLKNKQKVSSRARAFEENRLQWYVMAAGNGSEGSFTQLIERREYRCFYEPHELHGHGVLERSGQAAWRSTLIPIGRASQLQTGMPDAISAVVD